MCVCVCAITISLLTLILAYVTINTALKIKIVLTQRWELVPVPPNYVPVPIFFKIVHCSRRVLEHSGLQK